VSQNTFQWWLCGGALTNYKGMDTNAKGNEMDFDVELWLRGIGLGFAIAAPVGPIGLLCIRRTLKDGWSSGLLSGLGAASADAVYGSLAAFGLTAVYTWLAGLQVWIQMVGALFVIGLGIQTFRTPPARDAAAGDAGSGHVRAYFSTLLLTLSNPMTVLSFLAIFAGLDLAPGEQRWEEGLYLVSGVFLGSSLWWLILSSGMHVLRGKLQGGWLRGINFAVGIGLVIFGMAMLMQYITANSL